MTSETSVVERIVMCDEFLDFLPMHIHFYFAWDRYNQFGGGYIVVADFDNRKIEERIDDVGSAGDMDAIDAADWLEANVRWMECGNDPAECVWRLQSRLYEVFKSDRDSLCAADYA